MKSETVLKTTTCFRSLLPKMKIVTMNIPGRIIPRTMTAIPQFGKPSVQMEENSYKTA